MEITGFDSIDRLRHLEEVILADLEAGRMTPVDAMSRLSTLEHDISFLETSLPEHSNAPTDVLSQFLCGQNVTAKIGKLQCLLEMLLKDVSP